MCCWPLLPIATGSMQYLGMPSLSSEVPRHRTERDEQEAGGGRNAAIPGWAQKHRAHFPNPEPFSIALPLSWQDLLRLSSAPYLICMTLTYQTKRRHHYCAGLVLYPGTSNLMVVQPWAFQNLRETEMNDRSDNFTHHSDHDHVSTEHLLKVPPQIRGPVTV